MPRGKKKNQELAPEQLAPPSLGAKESKRYDDGVRDVPNEIISAIYDWAQASNRSTELHSKFSRAVEDQKWENLLDLIKMFGNS